MGKKLKKHPFGLMLNEPDGFWGVKWGASIGNLSDMMILVEDSGDVKFYVRKDDRTKVGEAIVGPILYGFYKERFYCMVIKNRDISNFYRIRITFSFLYGIGQSSEDSFKTCLWCGDNVRIVLDYDESTDRGTVYYFFIPVFEEQIQDEKATSRND